MRGPGNAATHAPVIARCLVLFPVTGLRSQPSASQKPGFIILETNYRLFAYTGKPSSPYHNQTPLAARGDVRP